ncbi:MAG: hypothetical protein KDC98_01025 [Planctomycetes bacterium]|nr:hypothetical protein [Planctomycetota bacterium]
MIRNLANALVEPLYRSTSTVSWWRRLWAWVWFVGGGLVIGTEIGVWLSEGEESWKTLLAGLALLGWALASDTRTLHEDTTVETELAAQERQRRSLRDRRVEMPPRDRRPWQRVVAWVLLTGAGIAVGALTAAYVGRLHLHPWRFVAFVAAAMPVVAFGLERDARSRGEPPVWHRLRRRRRCLDRAAGAG